MFSRHDIELGDDPEADELGMSSEDLWADIPLVSYTATPPGDPDGEMTTENFDLYMETMITNEVMTYGQSDLTPLENDFLSLDLLQTYAQGLVRRGLLRREGDTYKELLPEDRPRLPTYA